MRSYVFAQAETRVKEGIHTVEESVDKMNLIQQMVCQNPDFTSLIYPAYSAAFIFRIIIINFLSCRWKKIRR